MTETAAEYYVSKAPKPLRGMDYFRKRIQNGFKELAAETKCYVLGAHLFSFSIILTLFQGSTGKIGMQVGAFIFALGLLPLVEQLYQWAWRKLLGKLFIVALIALTTNLAYGFGRQMVAGMVGTSPETFAATVQIATLLVSPILFLLALAVGGIFIVPFAASAGVLALMFSGEVTHKTKWICCFIALTIAFCGSVDLLNKSVGYSGWVERRAASYLYTFDLYADPHYASRDTEKVALLSDGRMLVGTPLEDGAGYTFNIQSIQSVAKSVTYTPQ